MDKTKSLEREDACYRNGNIDIVAGGDQFRQSLRDNKKG